MPPKKYPGIDTMQVQHGSGAADRHVDDQRQQADQAERQRGAGQQDEADDREHAEEDDGVERLVGHPRDHHRHQQRHEQDRRQDDAPALRRADSGRT